MSKSLSANKAWLLRLLVLWITIVVVIASLIYTLIHAEFEDKRKETLENMCDQRSRILQDQFSATINHIHSLSLLISTFHYTQEVSAIDQKTFADYTARTSFERPLLSGVAYAQRVLNSERKEFEREHGWTIRSMETRKVSPASDEYAPVIFSQQTGSYIESLDMMSGEENRENILRARDTGNGVLITKPFRLLRSHRLGVVVTFPVFKYKLHPNPTFKQRIAATAGYISGAFDVESLVANLLGKLSEIEPIVVNVCDVTNISKPLLVYGNFCKEADVSVKRICSLDFGDPYRKHQMICWYRDKAPISWTAASTAFLFSVIGILIGYVVYNALLHITKVEDDFHQMQQLKIQAEAADVAKSQFLATVSHEIRTPLNGLMGMLTLILDTKLNFTQKNFAQTAQACGKSLITLINEVLDSAKIDSGKLNLASVPFNVRTIIDEVLSLFSEKCRHKGIELAGLVSDDVPCTVIGDPGRFRQVITNLVANSVKFTERGHVFVQVQLAKHDKVAPGNKPKSTSNGLKFKTLSGFETADDRNCWEDLNHLTLAKEGETKLDQKGKSVKLVVCVEDTGIGIPLDVQEHIYMLFTQADSSTSRKYGGTGLGLSICKCLVKLMQGNIKFISRSSIGTTFTFTATFISSDENKIHQDLPTEFEGLEAILVDDKPLRAAVTKFHLSRLGVSVEVASSFANIIYRSERQVDIVLVEKDTWMASTDWNKLKSGTMILLANMILEGEIEKSKEAGFEEVIIMKPLRAIMIAASLQQVLGIKNKGKKDPVEQSRSVLDGLLRDKKILVVDDNKVNRIVAAGALKKFGVNVVCVESGKAAIALFQSSPRDFDACFMDIQMPEMDGFEATRLIRKMESKLPILAMTADVMYATSDKCIECGMDGYVSKPFSQEDLYQALSQFFDLSAN